MKAKLYKILSVLAVFFFCLTTFTAGAADFTSGTKLYLKPNSNWTQSNARFAAYFFYKDSKGNESNKEWASMSSLGNDVYMVEAPKYNNKTISFNYVIFCRMNPGNQTNNWGNKWSQTEDLVYDGCKDLYTLPNDAPTGSENKATGTWSGYNKYFITGEGTSNIWCNGSGWEPGVCENMLVNNQITFTNLPKGDYQFKITNGSWETTYAHSSHFNEANSTPKSSYISYINTSDDNIKITTTVCSDITVKFNPSATKKISVEATFHEPKYLLMGVNTDWKNGIELVKNPDNGSEWMALGVEINAERDAVQIVTKDLCWEDDAFCNNVKYSTTVPYYVKDNNIILETGTYDFYFNPTENKVHIEGEVKKAVTVYLDINGKDWNNGRVALYYYKGDATRWVSAIACDGDNNIYYAQIPRGFDTYVWVKLKKDTDNSWDNKEKTEDQTVNIKLNSLQNLAKLTDDKDKDWHLKVDLSEYTGYCKQEFPIQVKLLNDPLQEGAAWKLDAQVVGEVGAQIEEYGFFIN
ncbi:MAG: hypothetical protein UIC45_00050, partial [Paludibacteraceae bacterium]|nr:hypothetical protein [Paludibacteraceae bacterium]